MLVMICGVFFAIGYSLGKTSAREQALNVVDRHQHIGIGDNHPIVARRLPSLDDIVEFGVGADPVVADQQARRTTGVGSDRAAHQGCDGIIAAGETVDDLLAWIIEREDRL